MSAVKVPGKYLLACQCMTRLYMCLVTWPYCDGKKTAAHPSTSESAFSSSCLYPLEVIAKVSSAAPSSGSESFKQMLMPLLSSSL